MCIETVDFMLVAQKVPVMHSSLLATKGRIKDGHVGEDARPSWTK